MNAARSLGCQFVADIPSSEIGFSQNVHDLISENSFAQNIKAAFLPFFYEQRHPQFTEDMEYESAAPCCLFTKVQPMVIAGVASAVNVATLPELGSCQLLRDDFVLAGQFRVPDRHRRTSDEGGCICSPKQSHLRRNRILVPGSDGRGAGSAHRALESRHLHRTHQCHPVQMFITWISRRKRGLLPVRVQGSKVRMQLVWEPVQLRALLLRTCSDHLPSTADRLGEYRLQFVRGRFAVRLHGAPGASCSRTRNNTSAASISHSAAARPHRYAPVQSSRNRMNLLRSFLLSESNLHVSTMSKSGIIKAGSNSFLLNYYYK